MKVLDRPLQSAHACSRCMLCQCVRLGRQYLPKKLPVLTIQGFACSLSCAGRDLQSLDSSSFSCCLRQAYACQGLYRADGHSRRNVSTCAAVEFVASQLNLKDYDTQQIQVRSKWTGPEDKNPANYFHESIADQEGILLIDNITKSRFFVAEQHYRKPFSYQPLDAGA